MNDEIRKSGNGQHPPAGVDLAKTVIVTGGAGLIGRRLVPRLLAEDLTTCVIVIDNNTTGSLEELTHALDQRVQPPGRKFPRTAIINGDVRELKIWQAVMSALSQFEFPPPREVYHLACPAAPAAWRVRPADVLLSAVMGTHQAATFAGEVIPHLYPALPPPRFVHLSGSAVYGGTDPVDGFAVAEDYAGYVPFTGPRACYDEGQRAAEALLEALIRTGRHPLDARVARPFTVYGPGMHPDDERLVSRLIVAALLDAPLGIEGDGSRGLSLIHVDDVVEALLRLMALPDNPGPLNLGDPDGQISIADLASAILRAVPSAAGAVEFYPDAGSIGRAVPDLGRVSAALPGWRCAHNLFDGIAETAADLKAHLARREELRKKQVGEAPRVLLEGGKA